MDKKRRGREGEQIMHMRDNANKFAAVYRTLPCNHVGCDGLEFM